MLYPGLAQNCAYDDAKANFEPGQRINMLNQFDINLK